MAGKFIELQEAAKLLGMSTDQLIELRSANEIHGYRDGASWKFKSQEIERFASEKGISLGAGDADAGAASPPDALDDDFGSLFEEEGFSDELDLDGDDDSGSSILVNDEPRGDGEESTSSTIIGSGKGADLDLGDAGSDLKLADGDSELGAGSELGVGSELDLMSESEIGAEAFGGSDVLDGEDSELKLASGSGTGDLSDALSDDIDDLDLESDVELALNEDDDLVLGASGAGSDVTLDAEGSGINLSSPADSGLSLEDDPLELGGSDLGSSLELPEDDDFISLDNVSDPDEATQLKQDEEFLLSASDDLEVEGEDSDSGSQVIALEDSEAFNQDAATMLQPGDGGLAAQVAPAAAMAGGAAAAGMAAGAPAAGMPATGLPATMSQAAGAPAAMLPAQVTEAPYSIWNVLALLLIVMVLSLTGMLMTDLIRNMWSWDSDYAATTSIMDALVELLPGVH